MAKKRAMITVDAEKWDTLQETLRERGYPPNSMSYYIDCCLDELDSHLFSEPRSGVGPLIELEIHHKGLKAALENTGMTVVDDKSESID